MRFGKIYRKLRSLAIAALVLYFVITIRQGVVPEITIRPTSHGVTHTEHNKSWSVALEEKYIPKSSRNSSFSLMGFAKVNLMERLQYPRHDFQLVMSPKNISCVDQTYDDQASWSMIVFVKSEPKNIDRRDLIRNTWGKRILYHQVRLITLFVLGIDVSLTNRLVANEQLNHNDLIQINLTEVYRNVGYKVLAGMQWVEANCNQHWMYASADDDMIPKLDRVYREVESEMVKEFGYVPIMCHFKWRDNSPSRDNATKNYVSHYHYSLDIYPNFCSGGFYSMSVSVASAILKISRYHKYFYNDDVWFTALLRLSAVDAGLLACRNISDANCGLSQVRGGSVDHADGNDSYLRSRIRHIYPSAG